jgi:3-hydroxyacyl-CoA dehydrogenase
MDFVAKTAYDKCLDDPEREIFKMPDYLSKMIENKWLGQKSGQGFYKKIDKGVIHSIDFKTLEYTKMNKKRYGAIALAKERTNVRDKISAIVRSNDVAGEFLWSSISRSIMYAADNLNKIADDIVSIDNSLKWGFGWELGPFEVLDAIGLEYFIERSKKDGLKIVDWLQKMNNANNKSMYLFLDGFRHYYCPNTEEYIPIKRHKKQFDFIGLVKNDKLIKKHWSASLIDLDDGVAGVQLHSVLRPMLNPIDGSMTEMLKYGLDWVKDNDYKGLVISGDGNNFCP